ncbi:tryptophan--tRNA ligase [Fervidicoccus fontis]|uniref:Tryptophan--tRNA ligase n=1 Tax=Fervidicoccus fontis TaxID=683846 RepID=A0A843A8B6_9CREN|nr:tryptophan--tRNA ligase [Fervidicoccus fontis]MBE9391558.1 tryptophan--tRNA ligase [Fervidicoccus fontis]
MEENKKEIFLDPWGYSSIEDYDKLFTLFGIRPFKEVIHYFENPSILMKRGIVFGHRDFDVVLRAFKEGKKVTLLTGFMPSGKLHFGHKALFDQIIYYQKQGFHINLALADIEAYSVRKVERKETIRLAIEEYVANAIALGLEKKNLRIYFQSATKPAYYRLIQMFSQKVTMAEMTAIYGDLTPGKIVSVFTQAADILHPMLEEFGGYDYVFVPVGADQDPHIRFTRDISDRFSSELGFRRPASTYHRFMTGLDGGKMSSSRPESAIFLSDPPEIVVKKLNNALTGGRATIEEQKRLGGEPLKCAIYEMYLYHLMPNDKDLLDIFMRCRRGELLCGEDKKLAIEKTLKFLDDHRKKLEQAKDVAESYIEEIPKF